jgi:hypothetical protein
MGEELGEPALGLVLDPEQHVGEVRLWVDVVALAHRDERVEDHEPARRLLVAEEEGVLPEEGDDPQRRLARVWA